MKKKICLLFLLLIVCMAPGAAWGESTGNTIDMAHTTPPTSGTGRTYDDVSQVYTITGATNVTVTGDNVGSKQRIVVAASASADITLSSVTIEGLDTNQSPLLLNPGANLTLTLEGTNILTAGFFNAGIQTPAGTTLTIKGTGSLTATGGNGVEYDRGGGAAGTLILASALLARRSARGRKKRT